MIAPELKKPASFLLPAILLLLIIPTVFFGCKEAPKEKDKGKEQSPDKKQIIYTCSMHPEIRQPTPGKCPKCGMDLIPATTSEGTSLREYEMSEEAKSLAEIEVMPVERKLVSVEVRLVGKVDYDETKLANITAYFPGRIEHLWIDYTGIPVDAGHKMATIYSPEILSTQEELLQALKAVKDSEGSTIAEAKEAATHNLDAVREKLRLWGLTPEQVKEIETRGKPSDRITINSPVAGIVIRKDAVDGMYVETGTQIYAIADLTQVWVKLDAYESDLKWIRPAQDMTFTTEAYPGEVFNGKIVFIDPTVNPMTRTIKVRVNVANKEGRLKPEMFVRAIVRANVSAEGKIVDTSLAGKWLCPMHAEIVKDVPGFCDICSMPLKSAEDLGYVSAVDEVGTMPLVIPASAPLLTGKRAIVYVQLTGKEKPTFEGREIVLGAKAGDYYIVKNGLSEGELVVINGAFKIDSALQLQAKPSMMSPEGGISIGEHHHGEMAGTAEDLMKGTIMLPAPFLEGIKKIEEAHSLVKEAIAAGDIKQVSLAFGGFEKTVSEIDPSIVPENAKMIWNELLMLLKNDAIEGKDAASVKEAEKLAEQASGRIEKLKGAFGITSGSKAVKFEVSPEFKKEIAGVFDAYTTIHEALAADDNDKAINAAAVMVEKLAAVDMSLLKGEAHTTWMSEFGKMKSVLSGIKSGEDIEAARRSFELVSSELTVILKIFGLPSGMEVYRIRCPMAFKRGAWWLQKDKKVRNPYFGSVMLDCHDVIEVIGGNAAGGGRNE